MKRTIKAGFSMDSWDKAKEKALHLIEKVLDEEEEKNNY